MDRYPKHKCKVGDGQPHKEAERVTCGTCHRSWRYRCDPCPSALCHWCHGRGYSTARVPTPRAKAREQA